MSKYIGGQYERSNFLDNYIFYFYYLGFWNNVKKEGYTSETTYRRRHEGHD